MLSHLSIGRMQIVEDSHDAGVTLLLQAPGERHHHGFRAVQAPAADQMQDLHSSSIRAGYGLPQLVIKTVTGNLLQQVLAAGLHIVEKF